MFAVDDLYFTFYHKTSLDNEWDQKLTCCKVWDKRKCQGGDLGILVSFGFAYCHENDNFSKRVGRKIALTRALENVCFSDKSLREKVWEEYFKKVGKK